MKYLKALATAGFLMAAPMLAPMAANAAEQTATLKVDGMTCQSCPYQVKAALKKVDGVIKADASYETGEAVVVYDDAKTTDKALAAVVINAGYAAIVKTAAVTKAEADMKAAMEDAKKAAAKRGSH